MFIAYEVYEYNEALNYMSPEQRERSLNVLKALFPQSFELSSTCTNCALNKYKIKKRGNKMSKQIITGMRELNFKDDEGRTVEGMTVYYINHLSDSDDGLMARGYGMGKFFIRPRTPLYHQMAAADYTKPFEAECTFDLLPGSTRPVLLDIKLLK